MNISEKCVAAIRGLSIDMVEKAKSGHPGAPLGLAPVAFELFSSHMKFNPNDPKWISRDRFVLSNGHSCALQYSMLHLLGYPLTIDDLKNFRQFESKTPGHPECFATEGVEVTTGPLGQGIANAVGIAMAEAHLSATFNKPSFPVIDSYTFCIVGDGCLQEGISAEVLSLAGHLKLAKLVVIYDDNKIQIDGSTEMAFTEDVCKRMEAYGFHVLEVEDGDTDLARISNAIASAKAEMSKPSFIRVRTTIGYGSGLQGTEKVHGAPLGASEVAKTKSFFGLDPNQPFLVSHEVYDFFNQLRSKMASGYDEWQKMFSEYSSKFPELASEIKRRFFDITLPEGTLDKLPRYSPSDAPVATRKFSENVLNAIGEHLPELFGGSADLTHSNLTRWKTAVEFQHPSTKLGEYSGRYVRFGVREHGMAGICNGVSAFGGLIPMCATFLNFITYAWGAVRLSALSRLQVLYIMTHDSIGLGEDGPTHQPIETLAALRALPNMLTFRPADGNEVSGAYAAALNHRKGPSTLCLSRQNLANLEGSSIEDVSYGAYLLTTCSNPSIILVGSGSEVSILVHASKKLEEENIFSNVVSMPCWELFDIQSAEYRSSIFPKGVPVLSLEALSTFGWSKYADVSIGIDTFGSSAPAADLYNHFGITASNVVSQTKQLLSNKH